MSHRITIPVVAYATLVLAGCQDTTAPLDLRATVSASLIPSDEYTAIDLGTGPESFALAINNADQVAGWMSVGGQRPFLWQNGVVTDLLAGQPYSSGRAFAMDEAGVVAAEVDGYASFIAGGTIVRVAPGIPLGISDTSGDPQTTWLVGRDAGSAWLWTPQGNTWLCSGDAWDVNRSGVILVDCDGNIGLWHDGLWTMIPELGEAFALNDAGQVAGSTEIAPGVVHAMRWENGVATDLGTLGGPWSRGFGMNSRGEVVGRADRPDGSEGAFVWRDGVMTELPGGGYVSYSRGINDAGQIVGYIDRRATLWRRLTPVQEVEQIRSAVDTLLTEGTINQGEARALGAKLAVATAMLNDGKPGPAVNQLQAFINQVQAFVRSGRLTAGQAEELITAAQRAIGGIQG